MSHTVKCALLVAALLLPFRAFGCTVDSTTLSFGSINPLANRQQDSSALLNISCPSSTSYTITLSPGSGSYDRRTMLSGTEVLEYNLYIDPQRSRIWGDGSGATYTVTGVADEVGSEHTIYGSVPPQPFASPGIYSDAVIITIHY